MPFLGSLKMYFGITKLNSAGRGRNNELVGVD
jgi:hypothetical protein